MNTQGKAHDYKYIAMACQGGGSLGSYGIGSLEAMLEARYEPNVVAGISIGAFTAAIMAGNEPRNWVEKLNEFWETISWPDIPPLGDGLTRKWHNTLSSCQGFIFGQPGFFGPRFPSPYLQAAGSSGATSFYDTEPLRRTLRHIVDFRKINKRGKMRLILGATRVRDGAPRWFDSHKENISVDHVMASGAMPPGFPGLHIDRELFWDGGCYSNTPLDGVYGALREQGDTLCFVIDLFGPDGREPQDIAEVELAMKNIQFSNRIKLSIERIAERHNYAHWLRHILRKNPKAVEGHPHRKEIKKYVALGRFDFVHILYEKPSWEVPTCDCEFSWSSIQKRRQQGLSDMRKALEEIQHAAKERRTAYDFGATGSVIHTFAKGLHVDCSLHCAPQFHLSGCA